MSTPAFKKWKGRNKRWLKPEMVYRAENAEAGIRVTVIPFYMGSHQEGGRSGKRGGKGGGRVKGGEEPEHYGSKQGDIETLNFTRSHKLGSERSE